MMVNPEYMAGGAEEFIARKRAELGLDKPLPVQYVAWVGEVAQGNLGYSFFDRRPVGDILKERLWPTTELMGAALLLALAVGVPLGLMAAIRQYSTLDYASAIISLATISTPSFFLGLAAIYIFSLKLNLLPTSGMFTAGAAAQRGRRSASPDPARGDPGPEPGRTLRALRPLEPARSHSPGLPHHGPLQGSGRSTGHPAPCAARMP